MYQFKSVTEEQGKTSPFSIFCLNSKYNIHSFSLFFSLSETYYFTRILLTGFSLY